MTMKARALMLICICCLAQVAAIGQDLISTPLPPVLKLELLIQGKGEAAYLLKVDGHTAFSGADIEKAPEALRERIETSKGMVVFFNGTFLGGRGLEVLTELERVRGALGRHSGYVNLSLPSSGKNVEVVLVDKDGSQAPRYLVASESFKEPGEVAKTLVQKKVTTVAVLGQEASELVAQMQKAIQAHGIEVVEAYPAPVIQRPFDLDKARGTGEMEVDPFTGKKQRLKEAILNEDVPGRGPR
jgi:hypothetical protein